MGQGRFEPIETEDSPFIRALRQIEPDDICQPEAVEKYPLLALDRDTAVEQLAKSARGLEQAGFPIEGRMLQRAVRTARALCRYRRRVDQDSGASRLVRQALDNILADGCEAIERLRSKGSDLLGECAEVTADFIEQELRWATNRDDWAC